LHDLLFINIWRLHIFKEYKFYKMLKYLLCTNIYYVLIDELILDVFFKKDSLGVIWKLKASRNLLILANNLFWRTYFV